MQDLRLPSLTSLPIIGLTLTATLTEQLESSASAKNPSGLDSVNTYGVPARGASRAALSYSVMSSI